MKRKPIQNLRLDYITRAYILDMLNLTEIAELFGISKQRVSQILDDAGVNLIDGGTHSQREVKRNHRDAMKECYSDDRAKELYGCTEAGKRRVVAESLLLDDEKNVLQAYRRFIRAHDEASPEVIPLTDWWKLWKNSGRWAGVNQGVYGITRIDFSQPYLKDNLTIKDQSSMSKDARERQHNQEELS